MTRKEEIREAPRCINIVPALGGGFCCSEGNYCTCGDVFKKSGDTALQAMTNQYHTALRRADMWRRRAEAAENKLQHITAPESSPAPLDSQEELWKEIAYDFSREKEFKIATGLQDLLKSKFTLMRNNLGNNQKGRTEGDLEKKVSPDLEKFHDLEKNDGSFEVDAGDNGIRYRPEPPTP